MSKEEKKVEVVKKTTQKKAKVNKKEEELLSYSQVKAMFNISSLHNRFIQSNMDTSEKTTLIEWKKFLRAAKII